MSATSLGLTSVETVAYNNLKAGPVETLTQTVVLGATPTIGQVLKYDSGTHKWGNFSSFSVGDILAIFADCILHSAAGTVLAADAQATLIVKGRVNKSALNSTAQADADIVAALLENGILAQAAVGA